MTDAKNDILNPVQRSALDQMVIAATAKGEDYMTVRAELILEFAEIVEAANLAVHPKAGKKSSTLALLKEAEETAEDEANLVPPEGQEPPVYTEGDMPDGDGNPPA